MTSSQDALRHEVASVNGIRMHYVTEGEGDLVVMLHGFPEFWYSWRHQIPALAARFRVVAPDQRGYNLTEKPRGVSSYRMGTLVEDIVDLIRVLGYERAVVVGHDWGGAVAWQLAITHPEVVRRLIVLNIPHPMAMARGLLTPRQLLRSWYIFYFQMPGLPELSLRANNYAAIEQSFRGMAIRKTAFSDEDIAAYKEAVARPGALTAAINWYRAALRNPELLARRQAPAVQAPTLMIWGENDTALGKELTYGTDRWVRDFRVHYIPNCSHWVQQEQPELVNRLMLDFLAGLPADRRR
ncbi:MAG: alpha/beta fold hydrolase [Dehalococcoidia bacterium]